MNDLLIGLVGAMLSTNPPAVATELLAQATGIDVEVAPAQDPVALELQQLMLEDDAVTAEIDGWIREGRRSDPEDKEVAQAMLRARIRDRLEQLRKKYESFVQRHPTYAKGRLAYGSFLSEIGEERAGHDQWEKARQLNPNDPAAWNNLANYYGHNSPVTNSFEYYQKAIDLDPTESVYYYNFATTVYLFRKDATNHFGITEAEVFDKAMALYAKALELDPDNFVLASEVAASYYGIKLPPAKDEAAKFQALKARSDKAIKAWHRALKLAQGSLQTEGVYIHLARNHISAHRFDQAERYLNMVTNQTFQSTKRALTRKMQGLKEQKD